MNFFSDKPLKVLAVYLIAILTLTFIAEYIIFRLTLSNLTEAERKIDFARSVQIQNQQLALQIEMFLQGKTDVVASLTSGIDHQDYLLKTLKEGGRVNNTDIFLDPLTRLPMVSFRNLNERWDVYKKNIQDLITNKPAGSAISLTSAPDTLTDSTAISEPALDRKQNNTFSQARLSLESQWLSLARWYDLLIEDLEHEVGQKQSSVSNWFSFFVLINIGGLLPIFYLFNKRVLIPLSILKKNTAQADFTEPENNEIGQIAEQVNATIEDLRDATEFVISIGEGKLDLDYRSLDEHYHKGKNKLADSLIDMQARLKVLNEEERKRQWINEGLTKFVDILRSSNDNLTALGDKIIAGLVQYTNSNQGAVYILNDDDLNNKYLELISLFAFDIKKHAQQSIRLGEGILGQTFLEKETTYITNIPESYIRITSGLGDATPRSVLMVPLKVDTQVYGILELASFNEYQPHEIGFVEKLGESIAATLASVKATQKNRVLIEQFQQQTEEMRAQEEEMRQNMEELQATQEEISRKEKSYIERIKELELLPAGQSEEIKSLAAQKEKDYLATIETLNRQLAKQPSRVDDWEIAEDVERMLRISQEALQVTQEELARKLK